MIGIVWRTHRRVIVVWVTALAATMSATAAAVASLYDTPSKIHAYAEAVTTGDALAAINGKVEGIDSLGGVIQDEFGFLASFLLPLLGVALLARTTRREEETGRLETILGGRIARHQPTAAALTVACGAIVATSGLFASGLTLAGVSLSGAVLYSSALGALAFVFAGFAALVAQLVPRARAVYTWSLIALTAAYVLRGTGDATASWLAWLSPLGWAEKTAPFGSQRWWILAVPTTAGLACVVASLVLAARRDVGSAVVSRDQGPARATRRLQRPGGFAVWLHLQATMSWLAGGVLLMGMMGALSRQLLDAAAGNPAFGTALGMTRDQQIDGFAAAAELLLATVGAGYVVQTINSLRGEESDGRLETRLAGTLSRVRWLAAHTGVVIAGLVLIVVTSSLTLALSAAWSVGNAGEVGPIMAACLAYLPAELAFAGLALATFGLWPRGVALSWIAYAMAALIVLLGPGLRLAPWVLDLAPATHVGKPPQTPVAAGGLSALAAVALALALAGFVGFGRRDVPTG